MWPAPGFEDTELGALMEPEVGRGETEVYPRVRMIALHKSQQQSQRCRSPCAFCEISCCLLFIQTSSDMTELGSDKLSRLSIRF